MTGEIGRIKPQERQLSDVEAVQAPVEKKAVAGPMQGLLDFANAAVSVAGPIYQKSKQEAQLKAQEEAKNAFSRELITASDIARDHGAKSARVLTFLKNAYVGSGLDEETKTKMMNDFQATVLGKSLTEVSPEDKAFNDLTEKAVAAGFIPYNPTPEQVENGTAMFQKVSAQQELDAAELSSLQLQQARLNLKSSKTKEEKAALEEGRKEIEYKKYQALTNLAANYTPVVKNQVDAIVDQYKKGVLTREDAEAQLKQARRDFDGTTGQLAAGLTTQQVDPLVNPMRDVYNIAIDNLDSTNLLTEVDNKVKLLVAKSKLNQTISNPDLVAYTAASSLTNHSSPALIAKINEIQLKWLKDNGQLGGKPVDITEESEDAANYLGVLTNGIKTKDEMGVGNLPKIDPVELKNNISNVLSGANRYIDAEDKPSQNRQILKWLADPTVGEYVKENLSSMPKKAVVGLTDTLVNSAVNHIYPRVQEIVASDLKADEGVEMFNFPAGQVSFRPTSSDPWHKAVADKLNKEVAGALTTYYKAIANISEDSFESIFERERPSAWPSKYQEEAPLAPQEQSEEPSTDYSQYEGQEMEDEEGNIFVITNGVPVAVGR